MESRDRILSAAIHVFAKKGRYGAHMEEIASFAHINKATIYYRYHSKDELYLEVLKHIFGKSWEANFIAIDKDIKDGKGYIDVIENYINTQFTFSIQNRDYLKIVIEAMSIGVEEMATAIKYVKEKYKGKDYQELMLPFFEQGKTGKIIRNIDSEQFFLSIAGMVMVYFITHPVADELEVNVKDESEFLEERRKSVIDLIMYGIINRND